MDCKCFRWHQKILERTCKLTVCKQTRHRRGPIFRLHPPRPCSAFLWPSVKRHNCYYLAQAVLLMGALDSTKGTTNLNPILCRTQKQELAYIISEGSMAQVPGSQLTDQWRTLLSLAREGTMKSQHTRKHTPWEMQPRDIYG